MTIHAYKDDEGGFFNSPEFWGGERYEGFARLFFGDAAMDNPYFSKVIEVLRQLNIPYVSTSGMQGVELHPQMIEGRPTDDKITLYVENDRVDFRTKGQVDSSISMIIGAVCGAYNETIGSVSRSRGVNWDKPSGDAVSRELGGALEDAPAYTCA